MKKNRKYELKSIETIDYIAIKIFIKIMYLLYNGVATWLVMQA